MKISAPKGIKDILPGEVETWQHIEETARKVLEAFGYSEIRIPLFEFTSLFSRSIGEGTDIVEKEMYTFDDRDGKKITLRPEGTASVVRAFIEHRLYLNSPLTRLYYLGPMFRHERPQAGRLRQFSQIGAEVLGSSDPLVDVEVLALLYHFLKALAVRDVTFEINSLGCHVCRPRYKKALTEFVKGKLSRFCDDCTRRSATNPLRILDCKKENCRTATANAPVMEKHLCEDCRSHFHQVRKGLDQLGLPFTVNPRLVRGLDYYSKTAFEITSPRLGAQNAVAAGGRYDGLVESLGGPPTPGIGFAIGMERLAALLEKKDRASSGSSLFLAMLGEEAKKAIFPALIALRQKGIRADMDYEGKSLKSQMRRADKLSSRYVLIVGEEEMKKGAAILRDMQEKTQREVPLFSLAEEIGLLLSPR